MNLSYKEEFLKAYKEIETLSSKNDPLSHVEVARLRQLTSSLHKGVAMLPRLPMCEFCGDDECVKSRAFEWHYRPRAKDLARGDSPGLTLLDVMMCGVCFGLVGPGGEICVQSVFGWDRWDAFDGLWFPLEDYFKKYCWNCVNPRLKFVPETSIRQISKLCKECQAAHLKR